MSFTDEFSLKGVVCHAVDAGDGVGVEMADEGLFVVGVLLDVGSEGVSGILEHGLDVVGDSASELSLPVIVGLDGGEGGSLGWHAVGNRKVLSPWFELFELS